MFPNLTTLQIGAPGGVSGDRKRSLEEMLLSVSTEELEYVSELIQERLKKENLERAEEAKKKYKEELEKRRALETKHGVKVGNEKTLEFLEDASLSITKRQVYGHFETEIKDDSIYEKKLKEGDTIIVFVNDLKEDRVSLKQKQVTVKNGLSFEFLFEVPWTWFDLKTVKWV